MVDSEAADASPGSDPARRERRELHDSEERFRLLVDSVVDYAIFLLDPDGVIVTWNAGAARLKGYDADEIIGEHYSIFYPPESRAEGLPDRLLAEAVDHGRTEHTGWRRRKDGSSFWADVVITALFDEDGRHTGFAKVTRDRTDAHRAEVARERTLEEQRRLVERLEELDAWRRELIRSVVHDLQTPVAAIGGFVRLLQDGRLDGDDLPWVLEGMVANTGSLQELIDNLRAYTALTEPRTQLEPERLALRPFVERLVGAVVPLLGDRRVEVAVPDMEVLADRQGLERVLRNLLTNVARHTPSGTSVVIRAREGSTAVVLEVEDDGQGIAPDLLPNVFERFAHGGKGGTGLGLAIARHYTELHGGTIEVESAVGEGATFRLTLPRDARSDDGEPT